MAGGRRGAPRLVARGTGRPMGMGRCGLANPPRAPPGLHLHAARTHLLSVHHHGLGSLAYGWLYATKLHVPHRIQYVYAHACKPGAVRKCARKSARERLRNRVPADILQIYFPGPPRSKSDPHHLMESGSHMSSREATTELRGQEYADACLQAERQTAACSVYAWVLNSGVRLCNLACISPAFLAVASVFVQLAQTCNWWSYGVVVTGCRSSQLGIFFYYLLAT